MENIRFNSLWKKAVSAITRIADGRVRPTRPWFEAEAPEGEEPEQAISTSESDEEKKEDFPPAEKEYSGVALETEISEDIPEESIEMPSTPEIEKSLLLTPEQKERVQESIGKLPKEFLEKSYQPSGDIPLPTGRGESVLSDKVVEEVRGRVDDVRKRLSDAEKDKFGETRARVLRRELAELEKELAQVERKYGPEKREETRIVHIENLAKTYKFEKLDELAAKYRAEEDPAKKEKLMADMDAEVARLESITPEQRAKESKERATEQFGEEYTAASEVSDREKKLDEAGGLAGELLAKKDNELLPKDKDNLGYVFQEFIKLLSRPELYPEVGPSALKAENKLVRKILKTMHDLAEKFGKSIKEDDSLYSSYSQVSRSLSAAIAAEGRGQSAESARQSSLEGWYGSDPIKIAIAAGLESHAGSRGETLRERHMGKKPVSDGRQILPDISTGVGAWNPNSTIEKMIKEGPSRESFELAIEQAMVGDPAKVSELAKAAYQPLRDEYSKLMVDVLPGSAEEGPEAMENRFVSDFSTAVNSVVDLLHTRGIHPGGATEDPSRPGHALYLPEYEEKTEKEPREPSEPRKLTNEEEVARAERWLAEDAEREEIGSPLDSSILYDEDGEVEDAQVLVTEVHPSRGQELFDLTLAEIERLESIGPDKLSSKQKEDLQQLNDNMAQLQRILAGQEETHEKSLQDYIDEAQGDMGSSHQELLRLIQEYGKKIGDGGFTNDSKDAAKSGILSGLRLALRDYSKSFAAAEKAEKMLDDMSAKGISSGEEHEKAYSYWRGTANRSTIDMLRVAEFLGELGLDVSNIRSPKAILEALDKKFPKS